MENIAIGIAASDTTRNAVKFTLKDYQEQAVDDVLANLKRARENFKNPSKREISSFSALTPMKITRSTR